MDTRGTVGRIYKEDHYTLLQAKYESFGPCGFGEEDFLCFTHDPPPGAEPVWTPGARLAGFIKRTTIHCYKQNMKALGLVVSEKKIFLCFTHDPPWAGPVWTPGARLAGFIQRTTIHCYKQNMKALDLVVSEEKILCFTHRSLRGGARMDPRGTIGRIYKEDYYTLLHTKYESFGPCGFGEDSLKFFPCRPHTDPGARLAGFIKRTTIHCY